jgi:hypothetical protein
LDINRRLGNGSDAESRSGANGAAEKHQTDGLASQLHFED